MPMNHISFYHNQPQIDGVNAQMMIMMRMMTTTTQGFTILTGVFAEGKMFQNLKVSSPAPVTIVCQIQLHPFVNL